MAIIKVSSNAVNSEVDVDIEAELQAFDFGYNARWTSDKLIAQSPFRTDSTPSFFVNLTGEYAGAWADSGSIDDEYASGGFVQLLAHLRGEGTGETADYLIEEYGLLYEIEPGEPIRISPPKVRQQRTRARIIDEDVVTRATSPYLITRGISADVQASFGVGYNEARAGFTAIPWKTPDGRIGNVKYRSTRDKRFFYERGATPVRDMVYGIDLIVEDFAVLVEGEIDAMSWQAAGISAIAVGGANITRAQADIIKRSEIRNLVLGGDNDGMGRMLNERAARLLGGSVRLYAMAYESIENKDANDVLLRSGVSGLHRIAELAKPIDVLDVRASPRRSYRI